MEACHADPQQRIIRHALTHPDRQELFPCQMLSAQDLALYAPDQELERFQQDLDAREQRTMLRNPFVTHV